MQQLYLRPSCSKDKNSKIVLYMTDAILSMEKAPTMLCVRNQENHFIILKTFFFTNFKTNNNKKLNNQV